MSIVEFFPASSTHEASFSWKSEWQLVYPNERVGGTVTHGTVSRNARCLLHLNAWTERSEYALAVMDKYGHVILAKLPAHINAHVSLGELGEDGSVYLDPRTNALLCHGKDSLGKRVDIYYPV